MEPLKGRAEQTSAKTAAVITMKTMVIRNEDLGMLGHMLIHQDCSEFHHIAAGPPARSPRKKADLEKVSEMKTTESTNNSR
jgi:hypothetical protein